MDKSVQSVNYSVIDQLLPLAHRSTKPFHRSTKPFSYGASCEFLGTCMKSRSDSIFKYS